MQQIQSRWDRSDILTLSQAVKSLRQIEQMLQNAQLGEHGDLGLLKSLAV